MKYLLLFVVLIFISGCGTSSSVEDSEIDILDPYADPPGYTGDPFAGFGPVTSIRFPAEEDPEIFIANPIETGGPWSVQVAACASSDAAQSLRDTLAAETDLIVFVDHIGSYYKVRVGSFPSSAASSDLRIQLRSNGYPEAWSVERDTTL